MDDTSPQVMEKMREMIRRKTPEERLKMGCSMHALSRGLALRFILEGSPGLPPADLKRELFLKFYENDFDPAKRRKIIAHLESV